MFRRLSPVMRKRFLTGLRLAALMSMVGAALLGAPFSHASPTEATYTGHYELADAKGDRTFSLDISQTGSRAKVSFSAAMANGSGAAPDGTGQGRVEDGVLSFTFKDSFENEGACILAPANGGYHLTMTVTKEVDPRPFHFYGTTLLKRTSDKPDNN